MKGRTKMTDTWIVVRLWTGLRSHTDSITYETEKEAQECFEEYKNYPRIGYIAYAKIMKDKVNI